MPSKAWLRKVTLKKRYAQNKNKVLAERKRDYAENPSPKKVSDRRWSQAKYDAHLSQKTAARLRSEANSKSKGSISIISRNSNHNNFLLTMGIITIIAEVAHYFQTYCYGLAYTYVQFTIRLTTLCNQKKTQ